MSSDPQILTESIETLRDLHVLVAGAAAAVEMAADLLDLRASLLDEELYAPFGLIVGEEGFARKGRDDLLRLALHINIAHEELDELTRGLLLDEQARRSEHDVDERG